jgi:hypothetical protein
MAMRIDWPHLARNLATHLHAAGGTDAIQRILDDAEKDAASLDAPADWWEMVIREYGSLIRPDSPQDHSRVSEMILSKAMR